MGTSKTVFLPAALAAHAVAALTMIFVSRDDIGTRVAAVIAIATLCFRAITAADRWTDERQNAAEYMFGFMLHANCFLVLMRLRAPQTGKSSWQRLRWATVALFTPRRELPQNQQWRKNCPERWLFLVKRLLKAIIPAIAYEYLRNNSFLPFEPRPHEIAPDKDSLIAQLYHGTLTRRDLLIRAEMTFLALTLPALFIDARHSLCSAIAVLFDSDLRDWPPLFGNPLDAYSVGQ